MTYQPKLWPAWFWNAAGKSRIFPGPDVPEGWMTPEEYHALTPLDLDGDGKPGGSLPESETETGERMALRAQLTELGIPYHHKMGVKRLRELLEG